jgi:hypothetical protein
MIIKTISKLIMAEELLVICDIAHKAKVLLDSFC